MAKGPTIDIRGQDPTNRPKEADKAKIFNNNLEMKAQKDMPVAAILDKYFEIISPVVETISREDLDKMSIQQIGSLLQLITETLTGKIFAEKKTLLPMSKS